jgi:uncharacterized protein (DUF169 family)
MNSKIEEALKLKYKPVAIILTDDKPEGAKEFKEGKWGCVMFMLAVAAKGKQAVFGRSTFGCFGGGVGLGFGNMYKNFPGGEEGFCYFLSTGNNEWEQGRNMGKMLKKFMTDHMYDDYMNGERYVKSPEHVKNFVEGLPMTDVPAKYVLFKPLSDVDPDKDSPEVIVFLTDMDQFSALTILANYGRDGNENVFIPYAAGCQTIGIYPFKESKSDKPRAVAGLTDISARLAIKRQLKDDLTTFAVPFRMFQEMEENVEGSFLQRPTWNELMELKN